MKDTTYNGLGVLLNLNGLHLAENCQKKDETLNQERTQKLNQFFIEIEKRVFRMAQIALGNVDDALDVVQDSMLKFVDRYWHKPESEWAPLFYRIVQNQIKDLHRKRNVRAKWMFWQKENYDKEEENIVEQAPVREQDEPMKKLISNDAVDELMHALTELPNRQQQVFLLRIWEGLDVAQTAKAMSCSQGSVKTHLSRAMAALRIKLKEHWS